MRGSFRSMNRSLGVHNSIAMVWYPFFELA
jgi:hypothetical protein